MLLSAGDLQQKEILMNQNIHSSLEKLPEFLSSEDLVKLGIYSSIDAAYQARASGHSPSFIKLQHLCIYPKKALIEFLENRMHVKSSAKENQ